MAQSAKARAARFAGSEMMESDNPYQSPQNYGPAPPRGPQDDRPDRHIATKKYRSGLLLAVLAQAVLLVFTSLLLDGGMFFRLCAAAAIAFWAGVLHTLVSRRGLPTKWDIAFAKFGFLVCFVLAILLAGIVLAARAAL